MNENSSNSYGYIDNKLINTQTRQSSITVAVRVRPFSDDEKPHLMYPDESMVDGESGLEAKHRSISMDMDVDPDSQSLRNSLAGDSNLTLPDSDSQPSRTNSTSTNTKPYPNNINNNKAKSRNTRKYISKPRGIWKLVECVDDKMIIFDPSNRNPLNKISENVLNSMYPYDTLSQQQQRRRRRNRPVTSDNTSKSRYNSSGNNNNDNNNNKNTSGETKFIFDKLFDTNATQETVYQNTTSPLLDSVLDGYNGTVFAYGATGCGKTFTVSGTPEDPGIIFRAMKELFEKIEMLRDSKDFEISLSFLEIYNETIRDLLKPDTPSKKLIIREDSNKKISVSNLSYYYPKSVEDVLDLVMKGNLNRTTSPTEANLVSSRSHAVLQIHILQSNKMIELKEEQVFGTLSIIDLAGSERAASTKNRGQRLYEGANINRSLLALGNCINALCISDGGNNNNNNNNNNNRNSNRTYHIPYRDSKLTRLLKFSLGGNCKTVMIVCISPSSSHYDETLNTLKYANRAKEIKTKVIRNQQTLSRHVGSYLKMITEQKRMIEELQKREEEKVNSSLQNYDLKMVKINESINLVINNIKSQYSTNPKYRNIKILKSLALTKRRFLQLVLIEIDNVLSLVSDWTDPRIISTCQTLKEQIGGKIKELEGKFDSETELNLVIERARDVDLNRLRELEEWDDTKHLDIFEMKMELVNERLQNEILINASMMIEKLLINDKLLRRFKFLSNVLATEQQDIYSLIKDLVLIDEEFDEFARVFLEGGDELSSFMSNENENKTTDTTSSAIANENKHTGSNINADESQMLNDEESEHIMGDSAKGRKKLRWIDELSSPSHMMSLRSRMMNKRLQAANENEHGDENDDIDISMQDTTGFRDDEHAPAAAIANKGRIPLTNYKILPPPTATATATSPLNSVPANGREP